MELTFTKVGDYYIPDLALDDDTEYEIGIYGRMREKFLKEHHPGVYNRMLLYGELWKHLAEIDTACHERMDFLLNRCRPVRPIRSWLTQFEEKARSAASRTEFITIILNSSGMIIMRRRIGRSPFAGAGTRKLST